MPFAIAMTLVVMISTLVLLYQFYTGDLARDIDEPPADGHAPEAHEPPVQLPTFRADTAA